MIRTPHQRAALAGIAVTALGLGISACGAANEAPDSADAATSAGQISGTLRGAGSSAQEAAMDAWRAAFQKAKPAVTVNYDPAGSGAGIEQFLAGATDFAGSDAALDPAAGEVEKARERCGADPLQVPNYISPIAIVFNVAGVDTLELDAPTLAAIFSGKITRWDDPAITAQNRGVRLPDTRITPVHRSDDSGTTENVTDYLHATGGSAWRWEADKTWPVKSGEAAQGTSGVIAAVKTGNGTIGYADDSQAGTLSTVSVKVGESYVAPSAAGATKALDASPVETGQPGSLTVRMDRTTTADGAYPVMLTSYLIACRAYPDDKVEAVRGLLSYIVSDEGQQAAAANAGSAPLPPSLQDEAAELVDSITTG